MEKGEVMSMQNEVVVDVAEEPIKGSNEQNISFEQLEAQAELGKRFLVDVDPGKVRGTCPDERAREGLISGADTVEPRPAVFGGPNIYALAVAELTGSLPADVTDGEDALGRVTGSLKAAGIPSGGHAKCAAHDGLPTWMGIIAENPQSVRDYTHSELGTQYNNTAMDEVIRYAAAALDSGKYAIWSDRALSNVLGEEAGDAIEKLAEVPHEGVLLQRVKIPNMTIDQTAVYNNSIVGPGTFDFDDWYAEIIENIVTSGPEAEHKTILARHAREAIIAAIGAAVPNPTLFQSEIH